MIQYMKDKNPIIKWAKDLDLVIHPGGDPDGQ